MKIFDITDENGKNHTVVAAGMPEALDLVSRERGYIDHADQCKELDWEESEFDISERGPEGAEYYWAKDEGEIVYRIPGHAHGDGQVDSDDAPVYLNSGLSDGEDDNVLNLESLGDVAIG